MERALHPVGDVKRVFDKVLAGLLGKAHRSPVDGVELDGH